MSVFLMMGEALGQVFGSLAAAALFCWACWTAFKTIRHPELGVPFGIAALVAVFGHGIDGSQFLRLTVAYAALAALVLWPIGLAWRHEDARGRTGRG